MDFTSLHCFHLELISSCELGHPPVPFSITEKKYFYIPASPACPLPCCRQGPKPALPVPALALPAPAVIRAAGCRSRWLPSCWRRKHHHILEVRGASAQELWEQPAPWQGGRAPRASLQGGSYQSCPCSRAGWLMTFSQALF